MYLNNHEVSCICNECYDEFIEDKERNPTNLMTMKLVELAERQGDLKQFTEDAMSHLPKYGKVCTCNNTAGCPSPRYQKEFDDDKYRDVCLICGGDILQDMHSVFDRFSVSEKRRVFVSAISNMEMSEYANLDDTLQKILDQNISVEDLKETTAMHAPMKCPKCNSNDMSDGDWERDSWGVWCMVNCNQCDNKWDEEYTFTSIIEDVQ